VNNQSYEFDFDCIQNDDASVKETDNVNVVDSDDVSNDHLKNDEHVIQRRSSRIKKYTYLFERLPN